MAWGLGIGLGIRFEIGDYDWDGELFLRIGFQDAGLRFGIRDWIGNWDMGLTIGIRDWYFGLGIQIGDQDF